MVIVQDSISTYVFTLVLCYADVQLFSNLHVGFSMAQGRCICMRIYQDPKDFCMHQALAQVQVLIRLITEFANMPRWGFSLCFGFVLFFENQNNLWSWCLREISGERGSIRKGQKKWRCYGALFLFSRQESHYRSSLQITLCVSVTITTNAFVLYDDSGLIWKQQIPYQK